MIARRGFVLGATARLIEGSTVERFGMFGKVVAKAGQRDALASALVDASRLLTPLPGCIFYIVNISSSDPDAVYVTEMWQSKADHDDSLKLDGVKELIGRTRPIIASFEGTSFTPIGGKGLPPA